MLQVSYLVAGLVGLFNWSMWLVRQLPSAPLTRLYPEMFMDIGKDITRSNTNCLFVRNLLFSSLCLPLSCSDVSHGEWIGVARKE
jgi:hypothetical protein